MTDLPPLIQVKDEIRLDAKLILIGEAPWKREAERGYPFAGWSGMKLRELWSQVGLSREQFSILNVYGYPRKPETVSEDILRQWVQYLHERLSAHTNPHVIVPVGALALWALTGKGYPPWQKPQRGVFAPAGIMKLRGSVLGYNDLKGRRIKVIPTLHPALLARQPGKERAVLHDWERVARESSFKEIKKIERDLYVAKSTSEVEHWVDRFLSEGTTVTFDIENPLEKDGTDEIVMIGFANQSDEAITIPTTESFWKSASDFEYVWGLLRTFFESPVAKCGQNVTYDIERLAVKNGIKVRNALWDTANMFHCLDPTEQYDLAYLASVYTNEEYWKDEAKDPEESAKYTSNMEAFYRYNGLDAAVTHELYEVARAMLEREGLLAFYLQHYGAIVDPIIEMMTTGVKVDETQRKLRLAHLMATRFELQDRLAEVVGESLVTAKSVSQVKLKRFLYETLRLPKRYKKVKGKEERSVTVDEVALRGLMNAHPDNTRLQQAGTVILELRFLDAREKYYKDRLTVNGRMYSKYSPRTEEGRLSSSASNYRVWEGTKAKPLGMNAQNIDREIRDLFLAG